MSTSQEKPALASTAPTLSQLTTVAPFVQYMEKRGFVLRAALEKYSLSLNMLANREVYVHSDIIYGLVADLADMSEDPMLGIHVGESMDFSSWPPFYDAVKESNKLGEFLTRLIEAIPKSSSAVRYKLDIRFDISELIVDRQYQPATSTVHIDAFGVAFFSRLFESVIGELWNPGEVTVRALDISGVPNHYKGMTIKYSGTSGVWIEFPTKWLFREIALNSALAMASQTSDPSGDTPVSVIEAFRALVAERLGDPDLCGGTIADTMGLSKRKLQRILGKQGTNSRQEIQRMRIFQAQLALKHSDCRISEVALQVGYSEPANFSRFFRRETGMSPRDFRKE